MTKYDTTRNDTRRHQAYKFNVDIFVAYGSENSRSYIFFTFHEIFHKLK